MKKCIIHYNGYPKYSVPKALSEINRKRILEAKEERQKLGGAHYENHMEQCNGVPEFFNENHFMHSEPCYKKFTMILSGQSSKQKDNPEAPQRKSKRKSSIEEEPKSPGWVYPPECQDCKRYRVKYQGEHVFPFKIKTQQCAESIKAAAKAKSEDLYYEIHLLDLVAREFKMHDHCRKKFLKGFGEVTRDNNERNIASQQSSRIDENEISKTDFTSLKLYIERNLIAESKVVSMKILQSIYGDNSDDRKARARLKEKILKEFPDKLIFVQPGQKCPEVVFSKCIFDKKLMPSLDHESNVVSVAKQLREDIISYCKSVPEHKWPPTFETLSEEYGKPPQSVQLFLKHLLSTEKSNKETTCRLIESFTSDFIHNISHGKVITPKHYLFALGLHNLTGQKQPVEITNKFGHCISYGTCCEIETALSEAAVEKSRLANILKVRPIDQEYISTWFWVDNFDIMLDKAGGGGSVNTTHLVAFQEQDGHAINEDLHVSLPRSRKRKLSIPTDGEQMAYNVDITAEPPRITATAPTQRFDSKEFNRSMFIWVFFRKINHYDQAVPIFTGWRLFGNKPRPQNFKKTVETYLPPITTKVTEFTTISKYMTYLQSLAASVNMPYTNITLDVGAAINAFKFLWSNQDSLSNVVIHLGDFHFMKENFQVIGMLIHSSGFKDTIFQSRVCDSGLNGVFNGSHYNRCWFIHSLFSEALERLLLERFLAEIRALPSRCSRWESRQNSPVLDDIPGHHENSAQDSHSRPNKQLRDEIASVG
ncbi:uncharacterized protein [Clytia hemisphaerica]|uniref:uncharacterized protein n=1 Tax=Clytia hemisphaerica TaxID=252671 RepID=UPI0034D3BFFF